MKYTLCITQRCNLNCHYCYIGKGKERMTPTVAKAIINFAHEHTPLDENIDFYFFGGEPLLEFELIKAITKEIEAHPSFNNERVFLTVVTNGTIFSKDIADFLVAHYIRLHVSCDGPNFVHNKFRFFPEGKGSSAIIETNIKQALEVFPPFAVNAVFHPATFLYLPQVIEYFSGLGIRHIYLNPDFSAQWFAQDAEYLPEIFKEIGLKYIRFYEKDDPHFLSLIDSKIAVILRGGYEPREGCRMVTGEFAFSPRGNIYPCERLIGSDTGGLHCIGNIENGFRSQRGCKKFDLIAVNTGCKDCGFNIYCMNWCGCPNFFSNGHYNEVGPFLCALEKASIKTAFDVIYTLEAKYGGVFSRHLAGHPFINSMTTIMK